MKPPKIETFGQKLQQLRLAAGLSRNALARLIGAGAINISRLERGSVGPAWETARQLALALGVTLQDLNYPATVKDKKEA